MQRLSRCLALAETTLLFLAASLPQVISVITEIHRPWRADWGYVEVRPGAFTFWYAVASQKTLLQSGHTQTDVLC